VSTGPDLLTIARTTLAASAASSDESIAAYFLACSRVTTAKLAQELRAHEELLAARETEFARRYSPKEQLTIASEELARTSR
jgi:hypothetical protein